MGMNEACKGAAFLWATQNSRIHGRLAPQEAEFGGPAQQTGKVLRAGFGDGREQLGLQVEG